MANEQIEDIIRKQADEYPSVTISDAKICLLMKEAGQVVSIEKIRKVLIDLYMGEFLEAIEYDERKELFMFRKDLTVKRCGRWNYARQVSR